MHVCVFVSELLLESFRERPGTRKQKETQAVIPLMNYSRVFACVCVRVFDCVLCKSTIIGLLTVERLVWESDQQSRANKVILPDRAECDQPLCATQTPQPTATATPANSDDKTQQFPSHPTRDSHVNMSN